MKIWIAWLVCLACFGACLLPAFADQPAKDPVDMRTFVAELVSQKIDKDTGQFAIWLPYEFLLESAMLTPDTKLEDAEKNVAPLKPYFILITACKSNGPDGAFAQGEKGIRARATLKLPDGQELQPVTPVPKEAAEVIEVFKSILGQLAGANPQEFHPLLFDAVKNGKPVMDNSKRNQLTLVFKADKIFPEAIFSWRTPFEATTKAAPCPKCQNLLSPKWFFCPWCGAKA